MEVAHMGVTVESGGVDGSPGQRVQTERGGDKKRAAKSRHRGAVWAPGSEIPRAQAELRPCH